MKKYIYSFIIVLVCILTSCTEEFLDINDDPNKTTTPESKYLFGYASATWSGLRTSGDLFIPISLSNQSIASGGNFGWGNWGKEDFYFFAPSVLPNTWKTYFLYSASNLNNAINLAKENNPKNTNTIGQSKILLANLFFELTMLHGDIPYSEALIPDIKYPKFDKQEDTLEGLLILLDEAIELLNESSSLKIIENDLYFSGDISKWEKYANSLKLKILMTMVDKKPSKTSDIIQLLNENSMLSSSEDNVLFPYYDKTGNENPKFKLFKYHNGSTNNWLFANENVFNFMNALNDPRIPIYFEEGPDAAENEFNAVATAKEADGTTSVINLEKLWTVDAPDVIFSYQEQLFFEAEIYARGLGVATDLTKAHQLYEQATIEAMRFYNVPEADITNYVNNDMPDISTMTVTDAIKEIHIQQWIDLMDRPLYGWIQSRRSGSKGNEIPNLTPPEGAATEDIIRRWDYSSVERTSNPNTPTNPSMDEHLWFDL